MMMTCVLASERIFIEFEAICFEDKTVDSSSSSVSLYFLLNFDSSVLCPQTGRHPKSGEIITPRYILFVRNYLLGHLI